MQSRKTPCRVIALASAKGGTGKTTLAACLAVEAARSARGVVLIDADPQQSLARWHELRRAMDDSGNPGLYHATKEPLAEKVARLSRTSAQWCFIDLPPGDLNLIEAGIVAAHFTLIPVRASPVDMEAIGPVVELCNDYAKPYGIVVNAVEPSWKISGTVAPYCEAEKLALFKSTVTQRQAYTGAMVGRTGPEYHDSRQAKACAAEISALWEELRKAAMSRGVPKI
jgi:chromosome partitioning protein